MPVKSYKPVTPTRRYQTVLSRELAGTAVIADIDNLKSINDQFGHAAGDAAIRAVATAIRSLIRADDLLFRWGGDEFLLVLEHLRHPQQAAHVAIAGLGDGAALAGMGHARLDELLVEVDLGAGWHLCLVRCAHVSPGLWRGEGEAIGLPLTVD